MVDMPKEPNLFDTLNAINKKIPTYKYSKKHATGYMLMLWLSHSPECMPFVEKLNERMFTMTDEQIFAALFKGIPKNTRRFLKWDKGVKDKKLGKKKEDTIQQLKDEHGFSDYEARTIFKLYVDR